MWLSLTDFTSRRSPLGAGGGSAEGSSCRWCRSCRWLWLRSTRWAVSMTTALLRLWVAMASSSSSSSPASQASLVLLSNSWKVLTLLAFTGVVGALGAALSKLQRKGSLYWTPQPRGLSPQPGRREPQVKRCKAAEDLVTGKAGTTAGVSRSVCPGRAQKHSTTLSRLGLGPETLWGGGWCLGPVQSPTPMPANLRGSSWSGVQALGVRMSM